MHGSELNRNVRVTHEYFHQTFMFACKIDEYEYMSQPHDNYITCLPFTCVLISITAYSVYAASRTMFEDAKRCGRHQDVSTMVTTMQLWWALCNCPMNNESDVY